VKRLIVFLCVVSVVLCVACAPAAPELFEADAPKLNDAASQASQHGVPDSVTDKAPVLPLVLINYESKTQISANSNAAYFIRPLPEELQTGDGTLSFAAFVLDFDTAKIHPLCDADDCLHLSDGCEAWLPSDAAYLSLVAAEDRLFWVMPYLLDTADFSGAAGLEGKCAHIDVSELDGSGKTRIFTAQPERRIDENALFYDGERLSFVESSGGDSLRNNAALVTVDLESGDSKSRELLTGANAEGFLDGYFKVVGVYENEPLFMQMTNGELIKSVEGADSYTLNYHVFSIDTQSHEKTRLLDYLLEPGKGVGLYESAWTGTTFIEVNESTREVIEIDLKTGTPRAIAVIPDEFGGLQSRHWYRVWDSKAQIVLYPLLSSCWLDLDAGALTEFGLRYSDTNGALRPAEIVADAGGEYLALLTSRRGAGGDSATDFHYVYGMIDKEDYWKGLRRFREVDINHLNGVFGL